MADYKVTAVSQTVKDWTGSYGAMKTYKLMLDGREAPVELNKKAESPAPTVGQSLSGTITTDPKFGDKIKIESTFGQRSAGPRPDNSDGQRQGMCINNAANYLVAIHDPKAGPLTAEEWAEMVNGYATALYAVSDLKAEPKETNPFEGEDPVEEAPLNADDILF